MLCPKWGTTTTGKGFSSNDQRLLSQPYMVYSPSKHYNRIYGKRKIHHSVGKRYMSKDKVNHRGSNSNTEHAIPNHPTNMYSQYASYAPVSIYPPLVAVCW